MHAHVFVLNSNSYVMHVLLNVAYFEIVEGARGKNVV